MQPKGTRLTHREIRTSREASGYPPPFAFEFPHPLIIAQRRKAGGVGQPVHENATLESSRWYLPKACKLGSLFEVPRTHLSIAPRSVSILPNKRVNTGHSRGAMVAQRLTLVTTHFHQDFVTEGRSFYLRTFETAITGNFCPGPSDGSGDGDGRIQGGFEPRINSTPAKTEHERSERRPRNTGSPRAAAIVTRNGNAREKPSNLEIALTK
ncbi:hypothetical protein NL676_014031 [Syzygium grande]|nr:hypothetical protein NL676_014031 [Syzygium grande]